MLLAAAAGTPPFPRLRKWCQRRVICNRVINTFGRRFLKAGTTRLWYRRELNSIIPDLFPMVAQPNRMARFSLERLTKLIRGIGVRQIRLACGLVLFSYLVSHF